MADNKPQERDELEHRKGHSFPLVIDCDMQEEMQAEATDLCVTGESFFRVEPSTENICETINFR